MGSKDEYMLQRDSQESKRLNAQHEYMRNLSGGHLTHPSIPIQHLQKVADVATGTGIWLLEFASNPASSSRSDGQGVRFVGFDISSQQFPSSQEHSSNIDFVIHDMTEPFPVQYHGFFDLVNVRFLSYVIKAVELDKVVSHILQILSE